MKKILAIIIVAVVLVASVSVGLFLLFKTDSPEEKYTISFDASGGEEVAPISVKYGDRIGALPLSYYPGSHLDGWHLGDMRYTENTVYNNKADITLKAIWSDNPVMTIIDPNEFTFRSKMWHTASAITSKSVPNEIAEAMKSFSGESALDFFTISLRGEGIVDGQDVELGIPLADWTQGDNIDVWVRLGDGSISKFTGIVDEDGRIQITVPSTDFTIGADPESIKVVPDSIELNRTNVPMVLGSTVNLVASVLPSNAVNKEVQWTTSDSSVASVLDGSIRALKTGTAVITAKTVEGNKVAQCSVTVTKSASTYLGTVYLEAGDGRVTDVLYGEGTTIKTIVESAMSTKGHYIQYKANNSILSVDGIRASGDKAWVLWKWNSTEWQIVSSAMGNTEIFEGVCFAVTLSEVTQGAGGTIQYSLPEDPVFTAYFFIQFKEDYNANAIVNSVYTLEERREGFWIVGKGRDPVVALEDAVYAFMFNDSSYTEEEKLSILFYNADRTHVSYGWLGTFCGLNDVMLEENDEVLYRYWSQYTWNNSTKDWEYNEQTLGKMDLSKNMYYGLVRQTTWVGDLSSGLTVTPLDCDVSYSMGFRRH